MKKIILILLILSIFIVSCTKSAQQPLDYQPTEPMNPPIVAESTPSSQKIPKQSAPSLPMQEQQQPKPAPQPLWKLGGLAIAGKYADADVVDLGNGMFRMYYSLEPEVAGFRGQVYSALSSDGVNWNNEDGERIDGATFPSVIKLPDGRYRMYFQNNGVIKSAVSNDGLSWKEESGTRIDTSNSAGLKLDSVLAPTVIKNGNEYILVYAGAINEKYPEKVPNNEIHLFLWATSADGLAFEKKGIALDSRNNEFKGWLDGAEFTQWDDGSLYLYFWSYKGVYHITFNKGKFSQDPILDFTTATDPNIMFPEDPPGDPTLAKINGKWFMYYGQHTKGIYYATLE